MKMLELSVSNLKTFDIGPGLFKSYRAWRTETNYKVVARDVIGSVLLVWFETPQD